MMNVNAGTYGALAVSVALNLSGRLAVVDFQGVLTDEAMALAMVDVEITLRGFALGFIVRIDRALVALTRPHWGAHEVVCAIQLPGAILATAETFAQAQDYARIRTSMGLERRAFTSLQCAESWVAAQVDLRLAQEQWRRTRVPASPLRTPRFGGTPG